MKDGCDGKPVLILLNNSSFVFFRLCYLATPSVNYRVPLSC